MQPNRLVAGYNNYQQQNTPFQNNNLLRNNPAFMNATMQNNSAQQERMRMLNAAMIQKQKEIQEVKRIEKLQMINRTIDKDQLREAIIGRPEKIKHTKQEKREIRQKWKEEEKERIAEGKSKKGTRLHEWWSKRTNDGYKHIIKDTDQHNYHSKFKNKKKIKQKDLVVHKTTDKDKEGVENEYVKKKKNFERHNDELKIVYSTTKKTEHKKKFQYNHRYKYRIKYTPSDHLHMKDENDKRVKRGNRRATRGIIDKSRMLGLYRDMQEDIESMRQKGDAVIETLLKNDALDDEEKEKLSNFKVNDEGVLMNPETGTIIKRTSTRKVVQRQAGCRTTDTGEQVCDNDRTKRRVVYRKKADASESEMSDTSVRSTKSFSGAVSQQSNRRNPPRRQKRPEDTPVKQPFQGSVSRQMDNHSKSQKKKPDSIKPATSRSTHTGSVSRMDNRVRKPGLRKQNMPKAPVVVVEERPETPQKRKPKIKRGTQAQKARDQEIEKYTNH